MVVHPTTHPPIIHVPVPPKPLTVTEEESTATAEGFGRPLPDVLEPLRDEVAAHVQTVMTLNAEVSRLTQTIKGLTWDVETLVTLLQNTENKPSLWQRFVRWLKGLIG